VGGCNTTLHCTYLSAIGINCLPDILVQCIAVDASSEWEEQQRGHHIAPIRLPPRSGSSNQFAWPVVTLTPSGVLAILTPIQWRVRLPLKLFLIPVLFCQYISHVCSHPSTVMVLSSLFHTNSIFTRLLQTSLRCWFIG